MENEKREVLTESFQKSPREHKGELIFFPTLSIWQLKLNNQIH